MLEINDLIYNDFIGFEVSFLIKIEKAFSFELPPWLCFEEWKHL